MTDPVSGAPLTAAEETKLRESVSLLGDDGHLQWTNLAMSRLLATLDAERAARAEPGREAEDRELWKALHAIEDDANLIHDEVADRGTPDGVFSIARRIAQTAYQARAALRGGSGEGERPSLDVERVARALRILRDSRLGDDDGFPTTNELVAAIEAARQQAPEVER